MSARSACLWGRCVLFAVPEGEGDVLQTVRVGNTGDTVLAPAEGARAGHVVGEVCFGQSRSDVVLAVNTYDSTHHHRVCNRQLLVQFSSAVQTHLRVIFADWSSRLAFVTWKQRRQRTRQLPTASRRHRVPIASSRRCVRGPAAAAFPPRRDTLDSR
jgi:hypothetical protein